MFVFIYPKITLNIFRKIIIKVRVNKECYKIQVQFINIKKYKEIEIDAWIHLEFLRKSLFFLIFLVRCTTILAWLGKCMPYHATIC